VEKARQHPAVSAGASHHLGVRSPNADFSPVAARYDETRGLPLEILVDCYARLVETGLLPSAGMILDAGCGTGQVSLPLVERRYRIHGIDISAAMLTRARAKLEPGWVVQYAVGNVCNLPFDSSTFDAVVISKLLQHVGDWRGACRELIRVLKPGAPIVQLNERGAFGNAPRRFFAKRADELGFSTRYVGANPHNPDEVSNYILACGCERVPHGLPEMRWQFSITYGEALDRIQDRLFAEFWSLPDDAYAQLAQDAALWVEAQPHGRDTVNVLTPRLAVEVYQTPAARPQLTDVRTD
jgi:ubiquinone/menaquinone biosynthesis C-methylase UbiE